MPLAEPLAQPQYPQLGLGPARPRSTSIEAFVRIAGDEQVAEMTMGIPETKVAQHAILAVIGLSLGVACFLVYFLPAMEGYLWLAENGYRLQRLDWVEPYGLRVFLRLLLVLGLPVAATGATVAGLRLWLRRALARQGGGRATA